MKTNKFNIGDLVKCKDRDIQYGKVVYISIDNENRVFYGVQDSDIEKTVHYSIMENQIEFAPDIDVLIQEMVKKQKELDILCNRVMMMYWADR